MGVRGKEKGRKKGAETRGDWLLSDFQKLRGLCSNPEFGEDVCRRKRQPSAGTNSGFCAMRLTRHRSLRMTATRATFLALPPSTRRL